MIQDAEVKRLVKESTAPSPGVDENTPIVKINPDSADFRGVRWGKEKKNIVVIYQNERLFRAFRHGL
ncbi:MAG: hypothetical protein K8T89_02330 [Planctomycetes bacterium]|nr:hypothetical protein [Planctomycetota bacterium]